MMQTNALHAPRANTFLRSAWSSSICRSRSRREQRDARPAPFW